MDEQVWATGHSLVFDDASVFTHIIRGQDDPERVPRSKREGLELAWKQDMKAPVEDWRKSILKLMNDSQPRTFNRIVLELTDYAYTADIAFKSNPDQALWELVGASKLEHTIEAPILFRLHGEPTCNPKRRRWKCKRSRS